MSKPLAHPTDVQFLKPLAVRRLKPPRVERINLTNAAARSLKPNPAGNRLIKDDGATALFLVITPGGHRSWMMRFRDPAGRPRKMVLGPLHSGKEEIKGDVVVGMPLTLKAAHLLAADVLRDRALNKDVAAEHKTRKVRQRTEKERQTATAFGVCVRRFFIEYKVKKSSTRPRRWYETAALLGLRWLVGSDPAKVEPEVIDGGLAQRWADTPVTSIDEAAILVVLDGAKRKQVPGLEPRSPGLNDARTRHLFSALSVLFGWLRDERLVASNPLRELSRPAPPAARERVLKPHELIWFWKACDRVGEPFGTIFKLLLLTGSRLREIAGIRRSELSEDGTLLTLPGARTKNRLPHAVPLPPIARALLAEATGKELVFTTTGKTPPSGWSRAKSRLDDIMLGIAKKERGKDAEIPDWRLHDLRRCFVTGMNELGVLPHIVEACVNHRSGVAKAGVAGVYNLAEFLPERRAALERWAAHVAGLVSGKPDNVSDIKAERRRRRK
ncbi:integrase [Bradyrhizobium sp. USDA 3240]